MDAHVKAWPALALAAAVGVSSCATAPAPQRFADIPPASAEECAIVRTALVAVLSEEPFHAKAVEPPPIGYIAVSPYLAADPFEDNPYEALKDQAPVSLAGCIGGVIKGPRYRIMSFKYPQRIRTEEIVDNEGWVSRPLVRGEEATVVLSRGHCYRTTTIALRREGDAWRARQIRHASSDPVWAGQDPCSPWP